MLLVVPAARLPPLLSTPRPERRLRWTAGPARSDYTTTTTRHTRSMDEDDDDGGGCGHGCDRRRRRSTMTATTTAVTATDTAATSLQQQSGGRRRPVQARRSCSAVTEREMMVAGAWQPSRQHSVTKRSSRVYCRYRVYNSSTTIL